MRPARASRAATLLLALLALAFPAAPGAARGLTLGATAAMGESGLIDHLAQTYHRETGTKMHCLVEPARTLMTAGVECTLDAFFSDIPEVEFAFMQKGYGEQWLTALFTHFVLVGPRGNPAKVPRRTLLEAMRYIAATKTPFASSRDGTGNRSAEDYVWNVLKMPEVSLEPWYITGSTEPYTLLPLAAAKNAYALTDAWAWKRYLDSFPDKDRVPLEIVIPRVPMLLKQYNIVIVSRRRCPETNVENARAFADWLISPAGQSAVNAFRYQGTQIFFPLDAPE